jgi:hypothetical protein
MNTQFIISEAQAVIRAAHFKYFSIDNSALTVKVAHSRNAIGFEICDRTVKIMTKLINRLELKSAN